MNSKYMIIESEQGTESRYGVTIAISANPVTKSFFGEQYVTHKCDETELFFLPKGAEVTESILRIARCREIWEPDPEDFIEDTIYIEQLKKSISVYRHISFYTGEYEQYSPEESEQDCTSPNIDELACQFNFAYNSGNILQAKNIGAFLYNEITPRHQGGKALLNLDTQECQSVGLAFATIALHIPLGDDDLNSVAAENAFYCLGRSYIETENSFVMPAIFSILYERPDYLKDKLIGSWCKIAEKQVGMPIGMMLGGNPYNDPRLKKFRNQALSFKDYIMYFALSKFYDIENEELTIPDDLCATYLVPDSNKISDFIQNIESNPGFRKDNFTKNCKEHFESVFHECEDTLTKC